MNNNHTVEKFIDTYKTEWEYVHNYTEYHIQVDCNVSCEFKIWQTNDREEKNMTPTFNFFNYSPEKNTSIISGSIKCKYIRISITPTNKKNSNYLKLSVAYKPNALSNTIDTNTKNYGTFWDGTKDLDENTTSNSISPSTSSTTLCIFGNTNASTTLTLQFGIPIIPSGYEYYSSQYTIKVNGDFGYTLSCPFYSVRLKTSENVNIKAYGVWS